MVEEIITDLPEQISKALDWEPRGTHRYIATGDLAEGVAKCAFVFKVGRATGCTTGYLHAIAPSVTVGHELIASDGAVYFSLVKGKVLAVLPNSTRFSNRGDSGSLVLNSRAEPVGVVTAVANGSAVHDTTYVSPFGPIIDHMQEILQRTAGTEKVEIELL